MNELAELLGESPTMQLVRDKLHRLLDRQRAGQRLPPILLQGETGTGKGLVARVLHRHSARSQGPFVDVNCAAIPETLLEAELFGFERGAFTDARTAKPGLFQAAHGGVLLLDEVGLFPETLQAKLLTALEERSVRRLGSTRSEPADAWLISATNTDLQAAVLARRFRSDLYHRLAVLTLDLPPLRDRGRDVLLLAGRFLDRACVEYGLTPKRLDQQVEARLLQYSWPGNVRELANVIERAALFSDTAVVTADALGLFQAVASPLPPAETAVSRDEATRRHLLAALEEMEWNISRTAARLGVARNTVYARMEKFGLRPDSPPKAGPHPSQPATSLPAPHAGLDWERRSIALLRADLADAETVDAWSKTSRALDEMIAKVHSFGGRLEEVTPTGLVAAFGIEPVEDAARCAAHAAMAMQRSARRARERDDSLKGVTIGLHVAPLLISRIGTRVEIDATSMRAASSMLEEVLRGKTPGEIVASRAAAPFLERRFDLGLTGAMADGQESAYRLTGQERRGLGLWGTMTRFVGRRGEIEVLQHRLALAGSGHGQVAAVVGEAGVGKSRLIHEFARAHHPDGWRILEGMSVSYGQAMSYLPVVDLLRQYFSIQDRDDLRAVREKITGKLLALDAALHPTLPAFQALLDVPVDDAVWQRLDPTQRRQRTLEAVKRLLLREAHEQPLLLIFEDLHWSDSETQALLETLVDGLGSARLLLLVSYRPEFQHAWGATTDLTVLPLENLPPDGTGELLEALLGEDPMLAPLKRVLIRRGNPFFLEETVRTLVETNALEGDRGHYRLVQPVDTLEVPPTVQALLAARIDRLPPEAKRLLQVTSVIGKDVPLALLRMIAGLPEEALRRELEALQSAEFVYEKRLDGDLEYAFKHALTHEVTYGGLLHERRRELHAKIVEAIETLHGDRLGEQIERLAHHAVRGELREKAVAYLRQAGSKAARQSALAGARAWFEQALEVLEALPESQATLEQGFEIRLELRPVLNTLGEVHHGLDRLREAEALAERLDDDRRHGRVSALITNTHVLLGDLEEAIESGTRALEIAGRLGDLKLRILATAYLEQAHHSRGDYERVVELATGNLAALPADWVYESFGATAPPSVWDRHFLVTSLAPLGRFAEATQREAEVLRLAEPTHHAFTVGLARFAAGMLHLLKGDWSKARSLNEQEIAVARTGNVVLLLPWAVASSAWILAQLGEASEALKRLREGKQLLEREAASGIVAHLGWGYHSLGRACLLLGRLDEARCLGDRAVDCSARQLGFAAYALHLLGDIAICSGRFDTESGEAYYRKALALAEPRGMRPLVAHCHLGLGRLHQRTGKRQQTREHLGTATTMYREMDMRFWLEQAEAETRNSE